MKKVIILSLMIVSALSVDAQRKRTRTATSQGNVVVRAGLGLNSMKMEIEQNPIYQLGDTKFEIAKPFKKGQTSGEMVEYHSNLQGLEVGGLIFVTQCGQYSYCFLYQQNKNKHLISNFESLISGFECKAN